MAREAIGAVWLLALASGCGGNVEGGGSRDPDPVVDKPTPDEGKAGPDAALPDGDTELGACVKGPKESYESDCPWVADDRCYAAREMACNCACPHKSNTQCASGFESGPNGHVWVSCN
jgi:hypothetical protein